MHIAHAAWKTHWRSTNGFYYIHIVQIDTQLPTIFSISMKNEKNKIKKKTK